MKPIKYLFAFLLLLASPILLAHPSCRLVQPPPTAALNSTDSPLPPEADSLRINYIFKLYGQVRRYAMTIYPTDEGGVQIDWTIFSYQKWLTGTYLISPSGLRYGTQLSFKQPQHGAREHLTDNETFGLISVAAFDKLAQTGTFEYSNTTYRLKEKQRMTVGETTFDVFYVVADIDETEMWIWNNRALPLICRIENNPLEINFYFGEISGLK